jgi:hypothetical protein
MRRATGPDPFHEPERSRRPPVERSRRLIDRRRFLDSVAAGTVLGAAAANAKAGRGDQPLLVIDCHAHIYSEDEAAYPTIENPYRPPRGTGTVAHLLHEMKANGVRRATAIQTSTFCRWDNRFLADSSRQHGVSWWASAP